MRDYLLIYVNGRRYQVSGAQGFQSLSDFLRYDLGLVGTKVVCAEGDCGSCTVLVGRIGLPNSEGDSKLNYQSINSCIQYLYQLDCAHIITVEALKNKEQIHPIQQAMVDAMGSQCGYCTPGFVMSLAAMQEKEEVMTRKSVQDGLTGNLCRCTGYEQIIDAALNLDAKPVPSVTENFDEKTILSDFAVYLTQAVFCEFEENWNGVARKLKYFVPVSLAEAVSFQQKNDNVTVVAGGTDISVQINKERIEPDCIMSLVHLSELKSIFVDEQFVTVGARVSWSELGKFCQKNLPQLAEIIAIFASPQIKNCGTLAGNIANASPIADSLPFLYVIEAEVELTSPDGVRWLEINQFYQGYKKLAMNPDELITSIRWQMQDPDDLLKLYKVSKRKDLDISTFTAGIYIKMNNNKIQISRLAYGGVGPVVLRLPETEQFLYNKALTLETFLQAGKIAREEIQPISDVRSSADYRLQLAENILMKFYYECCKHQVKKA